MRITDHFTLSEFTDSETARRRHIDNTPSAPIVVAITTLCTFLLEPLRQRYGRPIIVTSGYRCPLLNAAVGGATSSQHMRGEAADIKGSSPADNMRLYHMIRNSFSFDQVIAEEYDPKTNTCQWVHVSCKGVGNRGNALIKYKGKKGYSFWQ